MVEQYKKCAELGDTDAIRNLGICYFDGGRGLPQDYAKALELWHQAEKLEELGSACPELGNATSYYSIACTYMLGNGVERDETKAIHCGELAAMGGHVNARHNLGVLEKRAGNMSRALKHLFMIAVGTGFTSSLEKIKKDVHEWICIKR